MTSQTGPRINGIAVAYRDPKSLKAHAQNPNTRSPKQIECIARSIQDFGDGVAREPQTNPPALD